MITQAALMALTISVSALATTDGADPVSTEIIIQIGERDSNAIPQLRLTLQTRLQVSENQVPVLALNPRLGLYQISHPPANSFEQQDEIDLIFQTSNGVNTWARNLDVDIFASGQTGSMWVTGMDINAANYHDQYTLDMLNLPTNHLKSKGQGVLVAVLDTGIDEQHPELLGRVSVHGRNILQGGPPVEGGNGLDDDGDGLIDEAVGHGTFCSGLITLIAPDALILPVKVLNGDGVATLADIIVGMEHAMDKGAHVMLLALGTNEPTNILDISINDAIEQGVTIVSAVGNGVNNSGSYDCMYPASNPDVIAVGASDHMDLRADFSNYSEEMNLFAPGTSVLVDGEPDPALSVIGPLPDNGYAAGFGTSFSTAFAAGVAALVRAQGVEWPSSHTPVENISLLITDHIDASAVEIDLPTGPLNGTKPRLDLDTIVSQSGLPDVPIHGDINGDGFVSGADLAMLLGEWGGLSANGGLHRVDLVRNEQIDGMDLATLLGLWNTSFGGDGGN